MYNTPLPMYINQPARPTVMQQKTDALGASQIDLAQKDLLDQQLMQYKDASANQVDIRKCIVYGLSGALVGTLLGKLLSIYLLGIM